MSIPLLKKSLELVNTSYVYKRLEGGSGDADVKQAVVKISKRRNNDRDRRGVADVRNCNVNKLKQAKRKIKKTRENLERTLNSLEHLKKPCLDRQIANAILERNNKVKIEEYIALKEPEGTVFTEEDFQKFEECLRNEG